MTKKAIIKEIEDRAEAIRDQYDFTREIGWAQVEGAPIEEIVAYGAFDVLNDLLDDFAQ